VSEKGRVWWGVWEADGLADAHVGGQVFALSAEVTTDFRQMKLCQTALAEGHDINWCFLHSWSRLTALIFVFKLQSVYMCISQWAQFSSISFCC